MTATKRKSKPTTAHPMFPFVTALWCATLLGLGSFAIAPVLLEGPVVALGIPALVPAAAPPLGFTARVLFALVMLGLGGVAGFAVGRAMGRSKEAVPVRSRGPGKPGSQETGVAKRRVINPSEDLGAPLDAPIGQDVPLRRRALSLHDESLPSTAFEPAPVPELLPWQREEQEAGHSNEDPTLAAPADEPVQARSGQVGHASDPLALDVLFQDAEISGQVPYPPNAPVLADEDAGQTDVYELSAPEIIPVTADESLADVDAEPLTTVANTVANTAADDARLLLASSPVHQAKAEAAEQIEHALLESLGLVQLIERLALAISRRAHRAELATSSLASVDTDTPVVVTATPEIARFHSSSLSDPAQSGSAEYRAAPERVVQLRPAQFQPVSPLELDQVFDDEFDEDEDPALDRFLSMSPLRARTPKPVQSDDARDEVAPEPEVAEDRYSSLLDIGPVAARREPLRIDDGMADEPDDITDIEPFVVFPGQQLEAPGGQSRPFERPSILPIAGSPLAAPGRAAPSPPAAIDGETEEEAEPEGALDAEEADRALRAALATLQRMTAQG